ncbi:MAG: hypothetical protein K2O32_04610, partial [Acetatifactor sp.]|nr:hypothetical protein [Acetatifactor sp.]
YLYSIRLICLFLIILLIFSIYQTCKILKYEKKCSKCIRENWKPKYEEVIIKSKRWRCRFRATAIVVLYMLSYLIIQKSKYDIHEEFTWKLEERNDGRGLFFSVIEREALKEALWYEEMLHMDWYDNREEGEYIDRATLNMYMKNVDDIFSALPEKENRIGDNEELDSLFMEKKRNFEDLVKSSHKNLDSEILWGGYKDGIEVCKVYDSSENNFQTGVLAESACENAYKTQQSLESGLLYTAGMVSQFEKFLEFRNRDAGGGIEVSEIEVCFRMEKALYRASKENSNHDKKVARHCGLFAYCCSQYSVEKLEINDTRYLIYLDNCGLNCLNIVKFINDEELCVELCQKELNRWNQLEEIDMSEYKTEGKTLEQIMKTKERLESRVN